MTVYIALIKAYNGWYGDFSREEVLGVFDSIDKAQAAIDKRGYTDGEPEIIEHDIA